MIDIYAMRIYTVQHLGYESVIYEIISVEEKQNSPLAKRYSLHNRLRENHSKICRAGRSAVGQESYASISQLGLWQVFRCLTGKELTMPTAKELRALIVAHDKGKGTGAYVPCQCKNCESNRSKLFALTGKPSRK